MVSSSLKFATLPTAPSFSGKAIERADSQFRWCADLSRSVCAEPLLYEILSNLAVIPGLAFKWAKCPLTSPAWLFPPVWIFPNMCCPKVLSKVRF